MAPAVPQEGSQRNSRLIESSGESLWLRFPSWSELSESEKLSTNVLGLVVDYSRVEHCKKKLNWKQILIVSDKNHRRMMITAIAQVREMLPERVRILDVVRIHRVHIDREGRSGLANQDATFAIIDCCMRRIDYCGCKTWTPVEDSLIFAASSLFSGFRQALYYNGRRLRPALLLSKATDKVLLIDTGIPDSFHSISKEENKVYAQADLWGFDRSRCVLSPINTSSVIHTTNALCLVVNDEYMNPRAFAPDNQVLDYIMQRTDAPLIESSFSSHYRILQDTLFQPFLIPSASPLFTTTHQLFFAFLLQKPFPLHIIVAPHLMAKLDPGADRRIYRALGISKLSHHNLRSLLTQATLDNIPRRCVLQRVPDGYTGYYLLDLEPPLHCDSSSENQIVPQDHTPLTSFHEATKSTIPSTKRKSISPTSPCNLKRAGVSEESNATIKTNLSQIPVASKSTLRSATL